MKKIISIEHLLLCVCCCFALASCGGGGISGKWEGEEMDMTLRYEFSGNSYTKKIILPDNISEAEINQYREMGLKVSGKEAIMGKGKYSISEDKIEFFPDKEFHSTQGEHSTFSFSRTDNVIMIEGMRLTKK